MDECNFLFEVTRDIVLILDSSNFNILRANPTAIKTYGYNEEEFSSLNFNDLIKDKIISKSNLNELQLHVKKNNETFPVEIVSKQIDNNIILIIRNLDYSINLDRCFSFDFNNNLLSLFDSLSFYIFLKDVDNNLIWMNRGLAETLGIKRSDALNSIFETEENKENLLKFKRDDSEIIKNKKPVSNLIDEFVTTKGETKWVLTSKIPYLTAKNEVIGIIGISFDITQYRNQNLEFELLLNSTSDTIIIMDHNEKILKMYDEKLKIFNNHENIIGKSLFDFFSDNFYLYEIFHKSVQNLVFDKKDIVRFEFKLNSRTFEGYLDFFNHSKMVAIIRDISLR